MDQRTSPTRTRRKPDVAYAQLAEIAAERGLTLLTPEWCGLKSFYEFRCASGHNFTRIGTVAMRGTITCLECEHVRVQQRFQELLNEKGTVCREGTYLGQTVRQHFTCRFGHEWTTDARKILDGSGCPSCAIDTRAALLTDSNGLERLRTAAAAHGGKCLTDQYGGIGETYLWECANGHRWQARGTNIVAGGWCRACFARRNGDSRLIPERMNDIQAKARSYGGECLDETYHGSNAKYRFRCARGHEWTTWGHLVLGGKWCRRCANIAKSRTIEDMQAIAAERGGRCLSTEYHGNRIKLTWQCSLGHVWDSMPNTVINRGAWCPNCFRLRITRNPALRRRYDVK
ncbi:hypothetical protein [Burkholderia sp. LMG 32019]|uniref:hypothetical protein n=1 Tax=Burkholderia sp. LMG 32019 TaxID=3158173 RepID=UPI003C2E6748